MSELQIVFIDDMPEDVELAELALASAGIAFTSSRVCSEQGLLERLGARVPDAIVCDLMMPGFDGIAALRIVRRIAPAVPFIFHSGSISDSRRSTARDFGALGCADKSRPAEFVRLMRQALSLAV